MDQELKRHLDRRDFMGLAALLGLGAALPALAAGYSAPPPPAAAALTSKNTRASTSCLTAWN